MVGFLDGPVVNANENVVEVCGGQQSDMNSVTKSGMRARTGMVDPEIDDAFGRE
jgi:hypothetical protein